MSKEEMVSVPAYLIEAVAMIHVDFGYGPYELEQRFIEEARKIIENIKESGDCK